MSLCIASRISSHRCICSSIKILLLLYPPLPVVYGVCSEQEALHAINEGNASEKESACSLQLCHLKGTALRRDLTLKFNLKGSYLGINSQRQRQKQKGH